MIYLKRVFPSNLYAGKGIKVKVDSSKNELNLNASGILSIQKANKIALKLDYHHTEVEVFGSKLDAYYIVSLKPISNSILFFINVLFKSSLEINKVTEEEFNNYSPKMIYNNQIPFELSTKNTVLVFTALIIALFFVLFPLNFDFLATDISTMSFWFGALTFMGFISLFFLRKISEKQLYFRLIAFGIASSILMWFLLG